MLYLLHFDQKIADHAGHYSGSTDDLQKRLQAHRAGTSGARLMEVCKERGITWQLAATWEGSYVEERALKLQKNGPRYCPICRQQKILERLGL
jgi:predicted GIY-YIG superfamily endonuclease